MTIATLAVKNAAATTWDADSQMATTQEILQRCWKVSLDINIPTFKLTTRSVNTGDKLTKETAIPMPRNPLNKLRSEARNFMLQHGVGFDRGYLVPNERIDEVIEGLKAIGSKFNAERAVVPDQWEQAIQGLLKKFTDEGHIEDAELLLAAYNRTGGREGIEQAMGFRFSRYRIQDADAGEDSVIDSEGKGLVATMAGEISTQIRSKLQASKEAKSGFASSWKKTFESIESKLTGLSFLAPSVGDLAEVMRDSVIPMLGTKGRLTPAEEMLVTGVVNQLLDIDAIVSGRATARLRIVADAGKLALGSEVGDVPEGTETTSWGSAVVSVAAASSEEDEDAALFGPDDDAAVAAPEQSQPIVVAMPEVDIDAPVAIEALVEDAVEASKPAPATYTGYVPQILEVSNW